MKKNNGILTKIKHFNKVFKNKRTYEIFKTIIVWILCLKNWKQWDLANIWEKTLTQIQYFFYKSKWTFKTLNYFRINWIRNKIRWCGDKKSDIVILDWTVVTKNIKSCFSGLANWFFSNRDKKVVNWLEIFWASIITKYWIRYVLDLGIFFKRKTKRKKDERKWSLINYARRKFINKILKYTKAWLLVLDSGFKWANMCKRIYQVMKRDFLVRIDQEQLFLDSKGKTCKIKKMLNPNNWILLRSWMLWVIKWVILKSWDKKWVKIPVNIIIHRSNRYRKPLVLVSSADLEDIYENMVRKKWELSWKEKIKSMTGKRALISAWKELSYYYCFISLYTKRWSIEECFKELKSYLCFEQFKVISYESIMKYLHIVLLVHTLLTIMNHRIALNKESFNFIYRYLKEKRNIKKKKTDNHRKITIAWLKLFIEMMFQSGFIWKIKWRAEKSLNKLIRNTICVKSISSLEINKKLS